MFAQKFTRKINQLWKQIDENKNARITAAASSIGVLTFFLIHGIILLASARLLFAIVMQ